MLSQVGRHFVPQLVLKKLRMSHLLLRLQFFDVVHQSVNAILCRRWYWWWCCGNRLPRSACRWSVGRGLHFSVHHLDETFFRKFARVLTGHLGQIGGTLLERNWPPDRRLFHPYAVAHGAVLAIERFSADGSSGWDGRLFDWLVWSGCRADGETANPVSKRGLKFFIAELYGHHPEGKHECWIFIDTPVGLGPV
jgi:hypothetical protein